MEKANPQTINATEIFGLVDDGVLLDSLSILNARSKGVCKQIYNVDYFNENPNEFKNFLHHYDGVEASVEVSGVIMDGVISFK